MIVTKLGHCCLKIEIKGVTILTDPGVFSIDASIQTTGIDIILITHEHADHIHVQSLRDIMRLNPQAHVITNQAVGKLLDAEGISYQILQGTDSMTLHNLLLEARDGVHEEIFEEFGQVHNTGYIIDNTLFYPGDSFEVTSVRVPVLALPVAGPWSTVAHAINFALAIRPTHVFPVHDGHIHPDRIDPFHRIPQIMLEKEGITFIPLKDGDVKEFI
jgi:L-ascorbate metabolism protein UlaG (beta-lactamase superfamily)